MIPTTFLFFKIAVAPYIFEEISSIASLNLLLKLIPGIKSSLTKSLTVNVSFFPKDPDGWYFAKSSVLKPFKYIKQIAIVSPIKSCILVLVVGAKLFGHASFSIL